MKRRTLRMGLLLLLAIALVVGAMAMESSNYRLNWFAVGSSGGKSTSPNYIADITVGQVTIGSMNSSNYKTELGYWYGLLRQFRRYLPAVMESKTH